MPLAQRIVLPLSCSDPRKPFSHSRAITIPAFSNLPFERSPFSLVKTRLPEASWVMEVGRPLLVQAPDNWGTEPCPGPDPFRNRAVPLAHRLESCATFGPGPGELSLIPPSMFGPPELIHTDMKETDILALLWQEGGRVAWVPWNLGAMYYRLSLPSHAGFFQDLLDRMLHKGRQLKTDAHPLVEMTLMRQGERTLLHLINLSGHFQTAYFAPLATPAIRVLLEGDFRSARALRSGRKAAVKRMEGRTEIMLPGFGDYELVVLEKRRFRRSEPAPRERQSGIVRDEGRVAFAGDTADRPLRQNREPTAQLNDMGDVRDGRIRRSASPAKRMQPSAATAALRRTAGGLARSEGRNGRSLPAPSAMRRGFQSLRSWFRRKAFSSKSISRRSASIRADQPSPPATSSSRRVASRLLMTTAMKRLITTNTAIMI